MNSTTLQQKLHKIGSLLQVVLVNRGFVGPNLGDVIFNAASHCTSEGDAVLNRPELKPFRDILK